MKWLYDLIHGKETIVEKIIVEERIIHSEPTSFDEFLSDEVDRLTKLLIQKDKTIRSYEDSSQQIQADIRYFKARCIDLERAIELAKTIQFGGKVNDPS